MEILQQLIKIGKDYDNILELQERPDSDLINGEFVGEMMELLLPYIKNEKSLPQEYMSRDFCKAIKCPTQTNLEISEREACDKPRERYYGNSLKDVLIKNTKRYCHDTCMAWKFHHWLQEHGYKIIKEKKCIHDFIPVIDARKSICRTCGIKESEYNKIK